MVWKSSTVEFFYTPAPPEFEPRTSHTLAEHATDVATSLLQLHTFYCVKFITKTFFAQNLSVFVATPVARSARVQEVPGSNPGGARV